jgi:hypothetical protein
MAAVTALLIISWFFSSLFFFLRLQIMPRIAKMSSDPAADPAPIPALAAVLRPFLGMSVRTVVSSDLVGGTGPVTVAKLRVVITVRVAFAFKKIVVDNHDVVVLVVVAEGRAVELTVMIVVT